VFGRGVRPRVDNSDHRGQRVYEGSALAVLYVYFTRIYVIANMKICLKVKLHLKVNYILRLDGNAR